ncbi:DJ-1/PfpI family protein [Klebsiella grimontii]|uniref:DJ-1/PfpI family protein n=1 Tax=Klebsiella grimontii TaxID=2058152 RepID=UPI0012B74EC4|nr:DJ-1/PfpI family protein [Klebsiella grimontii]MBZ7125839.1 glutamine amidotransferase [Klebsiella grimontii]MBZ7341038.1 glutamine amidotransferase [Klebsiella grimontii]MDR4266268.1 glutamine amidotransferase [Klebsiella grimontii]QLT09532.1 DJ-1/PfpI family protein [Klebsiella grimontii]
MDTRKEVLFVLIEEYADWEFALLAPGLRRGFGIWEPQYDVRTVAADAGPVMSIGGVRCLPDYTFETILDDYAALVLVGGMNWWGEEARRVVPLVEQAQARQIVVGAICDASAFLGAHGFLNDVDHTSNGLAYLQNRAGSAYSGAARYRSVPSVRDGNLVTANGVGFVDFTCNMLAALNATQAGEIEAMRAAFTSGMFTEG